MKKIIVKSFVVIISITLLTFVVIPKIFTQLPLLYSQLYNLEWAGFGPDDEESKLKTTKEVINPKDGKITELKETTTRSQSAKTLWDWLGLGGMIAIPVVLFSFQQAEQRRSEKQAETEKQIADNNLREQSLEGYIDRMSELLIDKELKLLIGKKLKESDSEYQKLNAALDIVRARTLSVLRRLAQDGERKGSVIRFLVDAELINNLDLNGRTLDLNGANLSGAYLSGANLSGAYLEDAILSFAILSFANLSGANLSFAILSFANLSGAYLSGANLEDAILSFANLSRAELKDANLSFANLSRANIEGANLKGANLSGANLKGASLKGASLKGANLKGAKFSRANIEGANLKGANLKGANLKGAKFSRAYFQNSVYDNDTELPKSFDPIKKGMYLIAPSVNLSSANLSGANLSDANLSRANLSRANLSRANLSSVNLEGANLSGANLSSANLEGAKKLTPEQVKSASNWELSKYDKRFRAKLGLLPEPDE
ncbi:pentapeptide repeat-containing protein [Nostoc sp. XA013]|nr:pentapeptide repeat-containing protein [Nostoc sp. XA013]